MMRWISILAASMIVGLMATTFGCGTGNTPSQVVEKFYKLTQENDCQKVADLVSDTSSRSPDSYVNDCKKYADKLVSYSITGETIYEGGNIAQVDTEVTIKEGDGEKTNYPTKTLVKRGDDWKLTTTESR